MAAKTGTWPKDAANELHGINFYAGADQLQADEVPTHWKRTGDTSTTVTGDLEFRKAQDGEDIQLRRLIKAKIQGLPAGDVKDILTAMAKHLLRGSL